jgi:DNA invertase Pin-like site-specific DNA recombinase
LVTSVSGLLTKQGFGVWMSALDASRRFQFVDVTDFNSLHAQREACEAFIKSQAGEGWRLVKTAYDDGGLSGGTMERPALRRLLADINQGLIDIVVVYKVDRLTRSLADFAKMVEAFDAHGVSFVAVTQQFNTTTSMGRLTLNVLLSFAQFEREVTGERIRDKIAASKRKGMWMGGGSVPLGYDVCDRRIVIDEREAETVRYIFRRYQESRLRSPAQRSSGPPRCHFQAANLKDRNRVWRALILPRSTLRTSLESDLRR